MYKISNITKGNIERVTGLAIDKIKQMTLQEENDWVEKKCGRNLLFDKKKRYGVIGRGNPLLSRRKIRNAADLESRSRKYFGI